MKRSQQEQKPPFTEVATDTQDQDEVRRRAYEIYQQRGTAAGSDLEDWLQAEAEFRAGERSDEAA
jgi:hypothetical protein